jgi:hypothetical protein
MNDISSPRPPVSFWIVSGLSLLWNSFGAVDYTMTQTRNAAWLEGIPAQVIQAIDAAPLWATTAWALGVWLSLAGSVLLLLRSRFAVHAFAVSLLAAAVSFGWQFAVGIVSTPLLPIVILAIVGFLLWYAMRQGKGGLLR